MSQQQNQVTQDQQKQRELDRIAKQEAIDFRYGVAGGLVCMTDQKARVAQIVMPEVNSEIVVREAGRYTIFGIMETADEAERERRYELLIKLNRDLVQYNRACPKDAILFSLALAHPKLSDKKGARGLVSSVVKTEEGFAVSACLTSGVPTSTRPLNGTRVFTTPGYKFVDVLADANGNIVRIVETELGCFFCQVEGYEGKIPMIKPVRLVRPVRRAKNPSQEQQEAFERALARHEDQMLDFPSGIIQRVYEGPDSEANFVAANTRETDRGTKWSFDKSVLNALLDALEEKTREAQPQRPKQSAGAFLAKRRGVYKSGDDNGFGHMFVGKLAAVSEDADVPEDVVAK